MLTYRIGARSDHDASQGDTDSSTGINVPQRLTRYDPRAHASLPHRLRGGDLGDRAARAARTAQALVQADRHEHLVGLSQRSRAVHATSYLSIRSLAVFSGVRIAIVSAAPAIRLSKKSMSFETGSRFSSKATARALTKSDRSTKFLSPCRLDVGERRGDNFVRYSTPRNMVLQVRSAHTSVTDLPLDASVARRIPARHHRY
ncbi:hypothetical protein [Burkholderia ambifaria]|uniref:hypothetical protein n=1 Tax=Burkholderia ambifaria TaxID=152480 RepID=UPI00158E1605|nr:hypothetical protein [Burkholderia ambifaria]